MKHLQYFILLQICILDWTWVIPSDEISLWLNFEFAGSLLALRLTLSEFALNLATVVANPSSTSKTKFCCVPLNLIQRGFHHNFSVRSKLSQGLSSLLAIVIVFYGI